MTDMDNDSETPQAEGGSYRKTIGYRLQHAARLHRTVVARRLASLGLYPGQEQVLKHLQEQGVDTIGGLATALHVRPPTISKTIARLTSQGLIVRNEQTDDARVVKVSLSPTGVEKAQSLDAIWFDVETEISGGIDVKDIKRLRKMLRRIERQLGASADSFDVEDAE